MAKGSEYHKRQEGDATIFEVTPAPAPKSALILAFGIMCTGMWPRFTGPPRLWVFHDSDWRTTFNSGGRISHRRECHFLSDSLPSGHSQERSAGWLSVGADPKAGNSGVGSGSAVTTLNSVHELHELKRILRCCHNRDFVSR